MEVQSLLKESREYLEKHSWCKKICKGWLFTNIGFAVCIFLYDIENAQSVEDNLIWVITGDFPPMYLDTYNVKSTKEVIENYIDLATDWISHAESGESLNDCYPLSASTDLNSIELLKKKVALLQQKILPNIDDVNYQTA